MAAPTQSIPYNPYAREWGPRSPVMLRHAITIAVELWSPIAYQILTLDSSTLLDFFTLEEQYVTLLPRPYFGPAYTDFEQRMRWLNEIHATYPNNVNAFHMIYTLWLLYEYRLGPKPYPFYSLLSHKDVFTVAYLIAWKAYTDWGEWGVKRIRDHIKADINELEINDLEVEFLKIIDYRLHPFQPEFEDFTDRFAWLIYGTVGQACPKLR